MDLTFIVTKNPVNYNGKNENIEHLFVRQIRIVNIKEYN